MSQCYRHTVDGLQAFLGQPMIVDTVQYGQCHISVSSPIYMRHYICILLYDIHVNPEIVLIWTMGMMWKYMHTYRYPCQSIHEVLVFYVNPGMVLT